MYISFALFYFVYVFKIKKKYFFILYFFVVYTLKYSDTHTIHYEQCARRRNDKKNRTNNFFFSSPSFFLYIICSYILFFFGLFFFFCFFLFNFLKYSFLFYSFLSFTIEMPSNSCFFSFTLSTEHMQQLITFRCTPQMYKNHKNST